MASFASWPSQGPSPEIDSDFTQQEQQQRQQQPPPTVDPRFLLSPVPASMAQVQAQQSTAKETTATTPTVSGDSIPETITLYPLDPVPSHLLCAICTLPYENPVHFLPCCHVFCLECIQLWIGMNLSDDQLQGELRRAYPSEEEQQDASSNTAPFSPYGLADSQHQQQFMVELARMGGGDSLPRSRTSTSAGNLYDMFNNLTSDQQRLLQQQQPLQRVAVLLKTRDMPKCPMCRTALHIHGWDRIEEQIKVPVSFRSQVPRPSENRGLSASSSSSAWTEQSNTPRQRPVSGVERRRTRTNRFPASRREGRGESIGEEEEDLEHEDEEIEMEHVRTHRSRPSAPGHRTLYSPPRRAPFVNRRFQHDDTLGNDGDDDDEEEVQSPTTAVIGRRPSEWMRYQQRQLQAHQQQQRQQQSRVQERSPTSEMLSFSSLAEDSPHPHASSTNRYDQQQEQIRRLYQEQESQEELLRALSARAAEVDEGTTQETEATQLDSPISSTGGRRQLSSQELRRSLQLLISQRDQADDLIGRSTENETESQRTMGRQSLQIDTTLTRPSSRQSLVGHNATNRSRQTTVDPDAPLTQRQDLTRNDDLTGGINDAPNNTGSHPNSEVTVLSDEEQSAQADGSDGDSIYSAIQQGTRAWAERPSSLVLDLGHSPESLQLQDISDDHDLSVSDSVSDSTAPSSGSESPSHLISPSNESTLSYQTSSTYQNTHSLGTPISHRSSQPHWDLQIESRPMSLSQVQHAHSLQMPSFEAMTAVAEDSRGAEEPTTNESHEHRDEPWSDSYLEEEEEESDGRKARLSVMNECSTSTLEAELARAERNRLTEEKSPEEPHAVATAVGPSASITNCANSTSGPSLSPVSSLTAGTLLPSAWKTGPTGYSPLVRDLDIHTPIITTTEGSVTTLADMQMEADRLARAQSNSIVFSDDDSPVIREPPSPMDSPIPTPSTARPRNRFPSGFRLIRDDEEDDDNESFNDADAADEELGDEMDVESEQEDSAGLAIEEQGASPVERPETDDERDSVQDEELAREQDSQRQWRNDDEQPLLPQMTREITGDDSTSTVANAGGLHGTENVPLDEAETSVDTLSETPSDPLQSEGTIPQESTPTVVSIAETLTLVTEDPLTSLSTFDATAQEVAVLQSESESLPRQSFLAVSVPPALPMPLLVENPSESNQTTFQQQSEPGSPEITTLSTRASGEVRNTDIGTPADIVIGERERERVSPLADLLAHTPSSIVSTLSLEESFTENSRSTQGGSIPQQGWRRQDQDVITVGEEGEEIEGNREETLSQAQRHENVQRVRHDHENQSERPHQHQYSHQQYSRPEHPHLTQHQQQRSQQQHQQQRQQEEEERVHVHIQYRTLVRYQPRLPKAHVMSDLISQIRVQCPQAAFGCDETMEVQRAWQHGRDHCRFRKVMCPRARCGLWMRADQILEHILMVDPASTSSPPTSAGSSSSLANKTPSTSARGLGPNQNGTFNPSRRPSHGLRGGRRGSQLTPSPYNNTTRSSSVRTTTAATTAASLIVPTPSILSSGLSLDPRSDTMGHKEFMLSESAFASSAIAPKSTTTTGVPPCPGLTWEREQLTRATGIIGQLTEENTSLRQMIRQLQSQNSKMLKEKTEKEKERDRWQRFTNMTSKV